MLLKNDVLIRHWHVLLLPEKKYLLLETSHVWHDGVFTAADRSCAVDYCVIIYGLDANDIQ